MPDFGYLFPSTFFLTIFFSYLTVSKHGKKRHVAFFLLLKISIYQTLPKAHMASHVPRSPYTPQELEKLYPPTLRLEQAQIILRHGERTPVSARFQNAGLAPYWPYCNAARRFTDVIMSSKDGGAWDTLKYKRQMETIGSEGVPTLIRDSNGNVEGIW